MYTATPFIFSDSVSIHVPGRKPPPASGLTTPLPKADASRCKLTTPSQNHAQPSHNFDEHVVPLGSEILYTARKLKISEKLLTTSKFIPLAQQLVSEDDWDKTVTFSDVAGRKSHRLFMKSQQHRIETSMVGPLKALSQWLYDLKKRQQVNPSSRGLQLLCLWQDWAVAQAFDCAKPQKERLELKRFNWRTLSEKIIAARAEREAEKSSREESPSPENLSDALKKIAELKKSNSKLSSKLRTARQLLKETEVRDEKMAHLFKRVGSCSVRGLEVLEVIDE